jgi:hypothetical protein
VITPRAFVGAVGFRVNVSHAIRTRLDTVTAANAAIGVDQLHTLWRSERSMHRTDLITRRVDTVIAELWNEVSLVDQGGINDREFRFVVSGFWNQIDLHSTVFEVDVSLDPRAGITVGHMILGTTGRQAFS